jgi:hypothetical protein
MHRYKLHVAFVVALSAMFVVISSARAQSISDMDWDAFLKHTTGDSTQSHTDPFAGGAMTAEDLSIEELQLTGIVCGDEGNSYALISGYLVKPGDHIAGYRVDLIEKDKVRLRRVDDVFILALGGGI